MKYQVNLLPLELQPQPALNKARLTMMLIGLALATMILGGYTAFIFDYRAKTELYQALQQELATIKIINDRIEEVRREHNKVKKTTAQLQELLDHSRNWFVVVNDINHCVPEKLWLTGITLAEVGAGDKQNHTKRVLTFSGKSQDLNAIGFFVYNMQQLPHFAEVTLISAQQDDVHSDKSVFTFEITASFPGGDVHD